MAQARGIRIHQYLDDWLDSSPHQRILPPGHPVPPCPLSRTGLGGEPSKVGIGPQTGVRVCGLQVRPLSRPGQADTEPLGINSSKGGGHFGQSHLLSQEVHVPDRPSHCNRETSPTGKTAHEASAVASQETLEGSGISREGDSSSKVPSPTSLVDQGDKCLNRPTPAPLASCNSNLYRRLKRRLGCSLRRLHNKRHLVSSRKPPSHKFPGTKSRPTSPKTIPAFGARKSCFSCHRQHYSGGIHQQGGRYEVRLTLCPSMAAPMLVQSETGSSEGQAHPWSSECDCRQVVSTGTSHSDGVVPASRGLQPPGSNLAPSTGGHVCNKLQSQTTPICVPSTGSQCLGSGRSDSFLGKPGHVCFFPSIVTRKSGQQTIRSPLQESDHNSPRLTQHAMVLGSSGTVSPDPTVATQPSRPSDSAIQQGSSQQPNQPKEDRSLSSKGLAVLLRQNSGPQTRQRIGLCLFQERFYQGYFSCYNLFLD